MPVLLAQAVDLPVEMLEDAAIALEAEQVGGQALRSGIDDAAVGRSVRHDSCLNAQGAIAPVAKRMRLDVIAVTVDVGPGPVFGGDGHFMGAIEIGCAAVADGFDRKPGALAEV